MSLKHTLANAGSQASAIDSEHERYGLVGSLGRAAGRNPSPLDRYPAPGLPALSYPAD